MNFGSYPHGDKLTDNLTTLTARAGPDKAISAKEAEQNSSKDTLPLSPTFLKKSQNHSSLSYPPLTSPTYLGTSHFEPLLKNLNQSIELEQSLSLDLKMEKSHVPHLNAIARALVGLQLQQVRLARLVGRLYTSQAWDMKYVHAINTEGVRKLKARGGFEAYLNALEAAGRRL